MTDRKGATASMRCGQDVGASAGSPGREREGAPVQRKHRRVKKAYPAEVAQQRQSEDAERALGRVVARGLPLLTLGGAIVAGVAASVGSALLVLAAGALLGTIGLLWASVRTLSGDAPLVADLEGMAAEQDEVKALLDEKRRALRALKDLESEHALGKIDDADYEEVAAQYRDEAKRLMRAIDAAIAPYRAKAEEMARAYLEKQSAREAALRLDAEGEVEHADEERGVRDEPAQPTAGPSPAGGGTAVPTKEAKGRVVCETCGVSNESDAAFCKKCGASVVASGGEPTAQSPEKSDVPPA